MYNIILIILGTLVAFQIYLLYLVFSTRAFFHKIVMRYIDTVAEIHQAENKSLQYVMHTTHFNSVALRHTLNALRPYIISIMNNAVNREDFKEAQTCKEMLEEMDKIIRQPL